MNSSKIIVYKKSFLLYISCYFELNCCFIFHSSKKNTDSCYVNTTYKFNVLVWTTVPCLHVRNCQSSHFLLSLSLRASLTPSSALYYAGGKLCRKSSVNILMFIKIYVLLRLMFASIICNNSHSAYVLRFGQVLAHI